jgi:hypothetical protein
MGFYAVQLVGTLRLWEVRSQVSERAVRDLEAEALAAREGTLIIASAPVRSWEWAMPFITRWPFADPRVERRVTVLTPWLLDCCRSEWNARTRSTLRDWLARHSDAPIVALRWDAETGNRFRLSSEEQPYIRSLLTVFLETDSDASLDRALLDLIDRLPPSRSALTGSVQPGFAMSVQPGFAGSVQPGFAGSVQPGFAAPVQPGYAVSVQPRFAASVQPGCAVSVQTRFAASVQPGFAVSVQPGFAAPVQPGFAVSVQPGFAGSVQHGFAGSVQPGFAGPVQPGFAGSVQPGFAGSVQPGFAGSVQHGFAGSVQPGFAGSVRHGFARSRQPRARAGGIDNRLGCADDR